MVPADDTAVVAAALAREGLRADGPTLARLAAAYRTRQLSLAELEAWLSRVDDQATLPESS